MQYIPHKSAGPAVTDLIGDQVQLFMNNALPLTPFVKSGRIRASAVSGGTRLLSLPDVPTFTEAGLPGYEVKSWQGIPASAKAPTVIIDRLSQEIARILRTPKVANNFPTMGTDPFVSTTAQFGMLIKADLVKYAKLIKDAKIRLE